MTWVRKGFVHLFAIVLFFALLGTAVTASLKINFGQPGKLKTWLTQSHIYDHAVSGALDSAQDDSTKNGGDGSVSLSNPEVKKAAVAAFSPQLVQKSVDTIIDSNYGWLQGKTKTPTFNIDLSAAKQDFAKRVGQYVTTRLAALPVCTPAQILQLQIPVDVTTINCRPPTLVPQTEGTRITQELSSSQDFLKQPIVSANTLQQNQDNTASKPYYESASKAPRVYQALQKAPFALACIALISTVAIYYIATTRRRGQRRIAWVFLETGVLLVLSKIISGVIADKANDHLLRSTKNADLRAAGTSLIHSVQSHVAQINLYFGVIFLTIALVLYVRLYQNREGKGVSKAKPEPATDPEVVDDDEDENIPPLSHMDVSEIQSAPELPASRPPIKAANQAPKLKKPRPPKRPLIQ